MVSGHRENEQRILNLAGAALDRTPFGVYGFNRDFIAPGHIVRASAKGVSSVQFVIDGKTIHNVVVYCDADDSDAVIIRELTDALTTSLPELRKRFDRISGYSA